MASDSDANQTKSKIKPAALLGSIAGLAAFGTVTRKMSHMCGVCGEPIVSGQGYRVSKDKGTVHTNCVVSSDAKKPKNES